MAKEAKLWPREAEGAAEILEEGVSMVVTAMEEKETVGAAVAAAVTEKEVRAPMNAKRGREVNEAKQRRDERNGGTNRRRTGASVGGRSRWGWREVAGRGKVTFPEK